MVGAIEWRFIGSETANHLPGKRNELTHERNSVTAMRNRIRVKESDAIGCETSNQVSVEKEKGFVQSRQQKKNKKKQKKLGAASANGPICRIEYKI